MMNCDSPRIFFIDSRDAGTANAINSVRILPLQTPFGAQANGLP